MTLEQFSEDLVDEQGDPIRLTIKDAKGNLLADFDMDGCTHECEGVNPEELLQRQVIGFDFQDNYIGVTVQ